MKFDFENARALGLFEGAELEKLQVESINAILRECDLQMVGLPSQVAYVLATAYHECHNPKHPHMRLTPMVEFGGEDYRMTKPYYPYYGRGFSQLTWKVNYEKEAKRLELPLLSLPDTLLQIPVAANSHVHCMKYGIYTGKKLGDYLTPGRKDYVGARRIINGTDKAKTIAGYAMLFERCLSKENLAV